MAHVELDPYGFERDESFDHVRYEQFMSDYLVVLTKRSIKWQRLISQSPNQSINKSRKIKRYVRKGIPSEYRTVVWLEISSAINMKKNNEGKYKELLASTGIEKTIKDAIQGDLLRTYPENIYFRDTDDSLLKPLSNILTAYANHNPSIGYCQGLNYIAGMLLLVTKNEQDSFWILLQMLDEILPEFYSKRMFGLRVECQVLGHLIKSSHPDLHAHFAKYDIDMEVIATKWFVCLFMDVLPTETVLRIWDCILFEGNKILLRVAYTLIVVNKVRFMEKHSFTDIYEVFKRVTTDDLVLNCHEFMNMCFTLPKFTRSKVNKLRVKVGETLV